MKYLRLFLFFLLSAASGTTSAQIPTMPGDYIFTGPQYMTNEPFSSVVENEHTQTLADGTHLVSKTVLHLFRNSQGRVRREIYREAPGVPPNTPIAIEICDPVAGVAYNLQVQNHIAMMTKTPPAAAPRPLVEPASLPPSQPGDAQHQSVINEDLGRQYIQGCDARGYKMTRTIPVGLQGNDQPLVYVKEEWDCYEMRMMMSLVSTDSRTGKVTVRVTSLDRGEPDPGLFQVPSDYKIIEPHRQQLN